jgi:hypothetical protein
MLQVAATGMDGWMDGWVGGWVDGWMDIGQKCNFIRASDFDRVFCLLPYSIALILLLEDFLFGTGLYE